MENHGFILIGWEEPKWGRNNAPKCFCQFVVVLLFQRTDPQLLAQFYYADDELNQVAAELDSLDGRKDPQRCTLLVNQFRSCQVSWVERIAAVSYAAFNSKWHMLDFWSFL